MPLSNPWVSKSDALKNTTDDGNQKKILKTVTKFVTLEAHLAYKRVNNN